MRFCKKYKVLLINDNSIIAIVKDKKHVAYATLYGKIFEKNSKLKLPLYVVADIKAIGIPILRKNAAETFMSANS